MKFSLKKILIGILVGCAIAIGTIYIWSWRIMNKTYDLPLTFLNIPTDTASIQEGARLVRIAHCKDCHGEQFTGRIYRELDYKVKLVTPNVTQIISSYSNEELERLIRHGVKKNNRSVFFMPSPMYYELKDESVAKIIAYLRTLKPLPTPQDLPAGHVFSPLGRLEIIKGQYMHNKGFYKGAADRISHTAPRQYANHDTTQVAFGKYLAMTTCGSCHGRNLEGNPAATTPNLVIVHAYTNEQFIHLLKTGEGALGKKNLGLMSIVAKDHFSYMNEKEMNAIYSFLKTRGQKQAASKRVLN
jgi:cytochrome c553